MNVALWIGQALLAVIFTTSGVMKSTWPKQRLIDSGQTGVVFFPQPAIRVIAVCELLGVAGIILPWLTDIAPALTPLAASGFGIVMIGACITHIKLREPKNIAITVVIFVIAVLVAVGRFAGLGS